MKRRIKLISIEQCPKNIHYEITIKQDNIPNWFERLFGKKEISEERKFFGFYSWYELPSFDDVTNDWFIGDFLNNERRKKLYNDGLK